MTARTIRQMVFEKRCDVLRAHLAYVADPSLDEVTIQMTYAVQQVAYGTGRVAPLMKPYRQHIGESAQRPAAIPLQRRRLLDIPFQHGTSPPFRRLCRPKPRMTMPEIMHSTRREGWPISLGKYDVCRSTAHNFLVWIIGLMSSLT
jgi:hypothetical protein